VSAIKKAERPLTRGKVGGCRPDTLAGWDYPSEL